MNLFSYFHLVQHQYLIPFYKKYKLSPLQIQILTILRLRENLPITHSELSDQLIVSRPTLVESLKTLARKKLIERTTGNRGRLVTIRLSEKAVQEIEESLKPLEQMLMNLDASSMLYPLLVDIASKIDDFIANPQLRTCLNCLFYKEEEKNKGFCRYLKKSLSIYQYPLQCPYFTSLKELRSRVEENLVNIEKTEEEEKKNIQKPNY